MTFLKKTKRWRWLFWKTKRWQMENQKQKDDRWKSKNRKMKISERKKKSQRVRSKKFCLGAWNFDWKLHFSAFRCESNTWTVSKKWHLRVFKPSKNNWENQSHRFRLSFGVNFFWEDGKIDYWRQNKKEKKQSNDSYPPTHKYLGERHFTKKFLCDECNWLRKLHGTFMLENSRSLIGARQSSKMLTLVI